jgi:hypothetical protein
MKWILLCSLVLLHITLAHSFLPLTKLQSTTAVTAGSNTVLAPNMSMQHESEEGGAPKGEVPQHNSAPQPHPFSSLPGDPSLILTTNVDLGSKKTEIMKGTSLVLSLSYYFTGVHSVYYLRMEMRNGSTKHV